MLALSDSALARICIAATRVDARRRRRWLQEVAAKFDPPSIITKADSNNRKRTPAARRQARVRQRRKNGLRVYRLELHDVAVEGLIAMMIWSWQ